MRSLMRRFQRIISSVDYTLLKQGYIKKDIITKQEESNEQ